LHDDCLSNSILGYSPQSIFSTILKYEQDGFCEIFATFLNGTALSISTRDLWTVGYIPITILLYNSSELVMHKIPPFALINLHQLGGKNHRSANEKAKLRVGSAAGHRLASAAVKLARTLLRLKQRP
jgi:hypothetical protein